MFQVVMNKQETQMTGTDEELCKGLCYYIEALNKANIDLDTIQKVCDYAIGELKRTDKKITQKVKTIHEEQNFTIHEINTEGMSKEEIVRAFRDILNKRK